MPSAAIPAWLTLIAAASLLIAAACALWICVDEARRPQAMWIMNLVWPLTALFGGLLWLGLYVRWGRAPARCERAPAAGRAGLGVAIALATCHCGAGCVLGDILAEGATTAHPAWLALFGWPGLFPQPMFAEWAADFIAAFVLGVGFQYFSLKPMGGLTAGQTLARALKADALSIVAWQLGMYGAMAAIQYLGFQPAFGAPANPGQPAFWLAMQVAMLCGFVTAYPVNGLLIKAGVKERM